MAATMDFTVACDCGCPNATLLTVTGATLAAWQKVIANGQMSQLTCGDCGCVYNPADGGDHIGQADVSVPQVHSVSVASGPHAGGTTLTIMGHALDFGTVVILFNGVAGVNPRNAAPDGSTLMVDTPAGAVGPVTIRAQNQNGHNDYPGLFAYTA